MEQFAEGLPRLSRCGIAEPLIHHLGGGRLEPFRTGVVHGKEAECLGQGCAVGARVQEFDVRRNVAEHGLQPHHAHGSLWDRALGKNGGASGQRETLNDSDELAVIDREQRPLVIGDTDARRAAALPRVARLYWHVGSIAARYRAVKVTCVLPSLPGARGGRRTAFL